MGAIVVCLRIEGWVRWRGSVGEVWEEVVVEV
jgi:hypothetical protein